MSALDPRRPKIIAAPRPVPTDAFRMEAAIEMQTVIRYLQQAVKRADHRYLAIIPAEQTAELEQLAPQLIALGHAILPPSDTAPTLLPVWSRTSGKPGRNHHLTDQQARDIRAIYAAGGISQKDLGARFGVNSSTVWGIVHRKTYTHVRD